MVDIFNLKDVNSSPEQLSLKMTPNNTPVVTWGPVLYDCVCVWACGYAKRSLEDSAEGTYPKNGKPVHLIAHLIKSYISTPKKDKRYRASTGKNNDERQLYHAKYKQALL